MRRLGFATVLILLASLAFAVAASASTSLKGFERVGFHRAQSPSQLKLRRNKAAAEADAKHLVALVKLPRASTKSTTEPKGDRGLLKPMKSLESVLTARLAHAWYIVPSGAPDPYSYVQKHPPGGVKNDGTETSGGPNGTSQTLLYDFPHRRGVFARRLEVTFATLKNGDTGVLVIAQSNWIIPRPSSEKVPATATRVMISTAANGGSKGTGTLYAPITSKREVGKLIKLVNSPPIAQHFVSSGCPAVVSDEHTVRHTVQINFATGNGKAVAEATVNWIGDEAVGDWCNAISFKIGEKSQPKLIDTHFLAQVGKVTGLKLR